LLSHEQDFLAKESNERNERYNDQADKNPYLLKCRQGEASETLIQMAKDEQFKKNTFWYWNTVALCYTYSNQNLKAKFYFQTALQNSGQNKLLLSIVENNLGVLALKEKQSYLALGHFLKATQYNTNLKSPIFNLINLHLTYGIVPPVKKMLNKLLAISPNDPDLQNARGALLLVEKQYVEAKGLYERMDKNTLAYKEFLTHYYLAGILSSKKSFSPLKDIPGPIDSDNALVNVNFDKINKYLNNLKAKD
jgi:tetratricopeptide (TPR) repeat protein